MEDFKKKSVGDILIETVDLLRATTMEASIIKKRLFEDIEHYNKKIIVDLSKCIFVDSSFWGALVVSLRRTRETYGNIKLVIAHSFNEEVINYGGALRVFNCYTTVEDALNSYE
jgi:anti-anti-sigma factor